MQPAWPMPPFQLPPGMTLAIKPSMTQPLPAPPPHAALLSPEPSADCVPECAQPHRPPRGAAEVVEAAESAESPAPMRSAATPTGTLVIGSASDSPARKSLCGVRVPRLACACVRQRQSSRRSVAASMQCRDAHWRLPDRLRVGIACENHMLRNELSIFGNACCYM